VGNLVQVLHVGQGRVAQTEAANQERAVLEDDGAQRVPMFFSPACRVVDARDLHDRWLARCHDDIEQRGWGRR
jgi:hypothetical protein